MVVLVVVVKHLLIPEIVVVKHFINSFQEIRIAFFSSGGGVDIATAADVTFKLSGYI